MKKPHPPLKTSLEFLVVKGLTFETWWVLLVTVLLFFFLLYVSQKKVFGVSELCCDLWSAGTRCQYTANFACWSSLIPLLLSTPFLPACLQHSQSQHRRSCAGWELCLNLTPFTSHPSKPSTPSKISSKNVLPSPHSLLSFCIRMTHDEIHTYTLPVMQPRGKLLWPLWHLFSTAIMLKAIMLPWKMD